MPHDGIDPAISTLQTWGAKIRELSSKIQYIISMKSAYADDLQRMVGNTGIESLADAIDRYVDNLHELKGLGLPTDKLQDRILLEKYLFGDAANVNQKYIDVRQWYTSFLKTRAPEALGILESHL
jgi:hypothetical protein